MSTFFYTNTASTEIYTLSLHDALPICASGDLCQITVEDNGIGFDEKYLDRIFILFQRLHGRSAYDGTGIRSEEHTSELQSRRDLVCRLLLEKKKRSVHGNRKRKLYLLG